MKLQVLIENTAADASLCAEHGLSLYLETGKHKILFDFGQSDGLVHNARRMGVSLADVDLAVLSHGHYDHGGGIAAFLACNSKAPVYLSRHAFAPCYNGQGRYIGLDPALKTCPRLVFVDDALPIGDGLTLHACNSCDRPWPFPSFGLSVQEGALRRPDDFAHEQYLLVREGERTILLSGCSHKGVLNALSWFSPDVFIGGFHFMKLDPENPQDRDALDRAAAQMLAAPTKQYYTGHCTGQAQLDYLQARMGPRLKALTTGAAFVV